MEFLARRCAGDPEMAARVEAMLVVDLEQIGIRPLSECVSRESSNLRRFSELSGRRIGHYLLLRYLGGGGMGCVYEAADLDNARTVALKLLPLAFDERSARRFQNEARLAAQILHPNVAALYESGSAIVETRGGAGRETVPWLAVELVPGAKPFTEAVAEMSIDGILKLMEKVCRGVHELHSRAIVHRDLKPANILVGPAGEPKVIDFGIASTLLADAEEYHSSSGSRAAEASFRRSLLVGTYGYMAPELFLPSRSGGAAPPDIRQDIYSLGIVLYEALARRRAFPSSAESDRESSKRVLEKLPLLSTFVPGISSELCAIVDHATAVSPANRYASAAAMAADLRCYLDHRPISVVTPSVTYLGRKLLERRPWAVSLGAGAAASILLAWGVMSHLQSVAAREHAKAEEASNDLSQTIRSFTRLIKLTDPMSEGAPFLSRQNSEAERLLDAARDSALAIRDEQASQKGEFLAAIGNAYRAREHFDIADRLLRQSLGLHLAAHGAESVEVAERYHDLAMLRHAQRSLLDAKGYSENALALHERLSGKSSPRACHQRDDLADLLEQLNLWDKSQELYRENLELARGGEGGISPAHARLSFAKHLQARGETLMARAQLEEALSLADPARADEERVWSDAARYLSSLILEFENDTAKASRLLDRAAEIEGRLSGLSHPRTARCILARAQVHYYASRAAADPAQVAREKTMRLQCTARAVEIYESVYPQNHPERLDAESIYSGLLIGAGRLEEAWQRYRSLVGRMTARFGKSHPQTVLYARSFGISLAEAGHVLAARDLYQEWIRSIPQDAPELVRPLQYLRIELAYGDWRLGHRERGYAQMVSLLPDLRSCEQSKDRAMLDCLRTAMRWSGELGKEQEEREYAQQVLDFLERNSWLLPRIATEAQQEAWSHFR
ncbi:MAG: serine/threonine protein kinase [Planctomycetes bacterium]|nr:serine/threonine protein kinase [Planctomycetota bacterium]